jgi:hypothetical protein
MGDALREVSKNHGDSTLETAFFALTQNSGSGAS